jgi:hypothetical protein
VSHYNEASELVQDIFEDAAEEGLTTDQRLHLAGILATLANVDASRTQTEVIRAAQGNVARLVTASEAMVTAETTPAASDATAPPSSAVPVPGTTHTDASEGATKEQQ